ncbi:MAG: SprT-like domain-containing protein [Nitrospira sp.]|nr:SprT-like domain-containing protein [Nitrospira sp.]
MEPSVDPLLTMWTDLNRRYFQGALPRIPIEWSRRLTSSAGMFVCRVGPRHALHHPDDERLRRRCIRLSAVLLQGGDQDPQRETLVTLAHEMIHQWQYDILKRRPNHGPDFRRMMARMNQDGLGITIYHSLGKEVTALARYAWRCQQCGSIYRRQRRTIQPRRHLCGACRGSLRELTIVQDAPLAAPVPAPSVGRQFSLPFQSS